MTLLQFYAYVFHLNSQPPSGERAFGAMSLPFAWAVQPFILRLDGLPASMPITFVCGKRSWMGYGSAYDAQRRRSGVTVSLLENAGHHLFIDAPDAFNAASELD